MSTLSILSQLIDSNLVDNSGNREELLSYFSDLMQSNLSTTLPQDDFPSLHKAIKKRLLHEDPSGLKSLSIEGSFEFIQSQNLSDFWKILYFMYRLSLNQSPKEFIDGDWRTAAHAPSEQRKFQPSWNLSSNKNYEESGQMHLAKSLKKWNELMQKIGYISEGQLLAELQFVLQGSASRHFQIDDSAGIDRFVIDPNIKLTKASELIVQECFDLGLACRRIATYINSPESTTKLSPAKHSVLHSCFINWLRDTLQSYYREIATIETLVVQNPVTSVDIPMIQHCGLSMCRLQTLLRMPISRLSTAGYFIQRVEKGASGIALLNDILTFVRSGDHLNIALLQDLVCKLSGPILHNIDKWINDGDIPCGFAEEGEFFLSGKPEENLGGEEIMWEKMFTITSEKLPFFVTESTANKILVMGKSVWFLKTMCPDLSIPLVRRINMEGDMQVYRDLKTGSSEHVTGLICQAYEEMGPLLLQIIKESKYAFEGHLVALKNYLFCNRGDFVQALMDSLSGELSKPASQIHRHNLIGNLDVVMKQLIIQEGSNNVQNRLDVRLLKASSNQSGWEIFSLEYHTEKPLNNVLSTPVMASYAKSFRFIWRLKRCEHVLAASWKSLCVNQRSAGHFLSVGQRNVLHLSHACLAEMIHFVEKFLHYLSYDVIEEAWGLLEQELITAKDMDIYIRSHLAYIERILVQGIFSQRHQEDSFAKDLQYQLFQLLQLILSFAKHQTSLQKHCKELRKIHWRKQIEIDARTARGDWGLSEREEQAAAADLDRLSSHFVTSQSDIFIIYRQFKLERQKFLELLQSSSGQCTSYSQLYSYLR